MADVIEFDAATGEVTERDFTSQELAQREADAAAAEQAAAEQAEREAKREAALAKLEALGLNVDDLAALGL